MLMAFLSDSDRTTDRSSDDSSGSFFEPLVGELVPLKTKHEVQALNETVDAFVIALPKRIASKAVAVVKPISPTPPPGQPSFQHLRRFANTSHLPKHLRQEFTEKCPGVQEDDVVHFLVSPPLPDDPPKIVSSFRSFVDTDFPLVLRSCVIPVYPPVSQEQARRNTEKYWPCSYNPAAQTVQQAPSFHTMRKVTSELSSGQWHVGHYMRLAQQAADEVFVQGIGRRCGAVAVDGSTGQVVALAGDARWKSTPPSQDNDEGRPEHHALMRVIAMVAAKERLTRKMAERACMQGMDEADEPFTTIEHQYFGSLPHVPQEYPPSRNALPAGEDAGQLGYLCANLDIYLTHEPCVMCSMGMVHSRFRACVFGQRMDGTGGLCAEKGICVGYGLSWRKELNWRVMAFEYQETDREKGEMVELFSA